MAKPVTLTDDVQNYLQQREPTLCWPVVNQFDTADAGAGVYLPEGWTGAVVYLVQRWRKTTPEGIKYDEVLDSIHASVESARERIAALIIRGYNAIIDTEPIYVSGQAVIPMGLDYASWPPPRPAPLVPDL